MCGRRGCGSKALVPAHGCAPKPAAPKDPRAARRGRLSAPTPSPSLPDPAWRPARAPKPGAPDAAALLGPCEARRVERVRCPTHQCPGRMPRTGLLAGTRTGSPLRAGCSRWLLRALCTPRRQRPSPREGPRVLLSMALVRKSCWPRGLAVRPAPPRREQRSSCAWRAHSVPCVVLPGGLRGPSALCVHRRPRDGPPLRAPPLCEGSVKRRVNTRETTDRGIIAKNHEDVQFFSTTKLLKKEKLPATSGTRH